jgi:hypothetical protein
MTGALINLGELSKPATVLIEKVSDAVGGIAKPWQIKRVANAEAEAEKIKALAQIEISDIQQRALVRMVQEEGIKQENIENITAGAIPHLNNNADPSKVEDDWLAHFFEKSRLVSNPDMQALWSRILAGEANHPNSFSRRTVELISTLSKEDAQSFTELCSMVWNFGILECVYPYDDKNFVKEFGNMLPFAKLRHLDSIGLITFNHTSAGVFNFPESQKYLNLYYYGAPLAVELFNPGGATRPIVHGHVSLTQTGKELAAISGASPNYAYFEYILTRWIKDGHIFSTPIKAKGLWLRFNRPTDG